MSSALLRDATTVAFIGDLHGNARYGIKAIRYGVEHEARLFVQLGDFGYDYRDSFTQGLEDELKRVDGLLIFVDGNHEDFTKLHSWPVDEDGFRQISPRIWHAPRGHRWVTDGVSFLALGGAHSVDRRWRTHGHSWWPEETLTRGDVARACAGGEVDVIIAHDAPAGHVIPEIARNAHRFPEEELHASDRHRELVAEVCRVTEPALVYHGHYHVAYTAHSLIGGRSARHHTMINGLNCDETPLKQSVRVHTTAWLRGIIADARWERELVENLREIDETPVDIERAL